MAEPMSDHEKEYERLRSELSDAVRKLSDLIQEEPSLLLGGIVVWETSRFDSEGRQVYNTHHTILDTGSLIHSVGLTQVANARLVDYLNSPDGCGHDHE